MADEQASASDPELQQLDQEEPEELDSIVVDEEVSSKADSVDEPEAEEYDPANDGDDSILAEVVKEKVTPDA